MSDARRLFWIRLALCGAVILAGLSLRRWGIGAGLSFIVVKYGGSLLWGAMAYLLVALVMGARRRELIVATALLVATAVELFRLFHTPLLDAFRLTPAGALLLGRVFSLWNIVAYAAGILLGWRLDDMLDERGRDHAI